MKMRFTSITSLLSLASGVLPSVAGSAVGLDVRASPGKTVAETLHALRHHLNDARLHRRDEVFSNSTEIEAAFRSTTLLKMYATHCCCCSR